jgi:flagellar biosynthesis/type III secretory pathway M-ring protein FliF/YscJ
MQALRNTLNALRQQLGEFSPAAKMLVAALMIILVMGLMFVALYAGRSDMVALGLDGPANTEAKALAIRYLRDRSITWKDRNGDVYVPAEHRIPILATLAESKQITTDQINFSTILKDASPFTSRDLQKRQFLVAKMNVVAGMISEMSGVDRATVVIDQPERSGIGHAHVPPSASVTVMPSGDHVTQTQADAIARMVAGAHAALHIENVEVIDARTSRSIRAQGDDAMMANRHLELKQAHEKRVEANIRKLLGHIRGVLIAVNAQIDASETLRREVDVKDPKLGVERESAYERTASNQYGPTEPGVRPNAGQVTLVTNARTSSVNENRVDTKTRPAFGKTELEKREDQGYAVQINATVKVPRSWFVQLYRIEQGDEQAEPSEQQLQPIIDRETQRLQGEIEPLIDTDAMQRAQAGTVVVSMYADLAAASVGALGGPGVAGGGGEGIADGIVGNGVLKTVGLAALALVSLVLMFMMVRKAGQREELPTAEELVGIPPALAGDDGDLVGEASESAPAMEGVEIDDESLRRKQMLDQINELAVKEPGEAATLLRKWIASND